MTAVPVPNRRREASSGSEAETRPDLRVVTPARRRHTAAYSIALVVLCAATIFGTVSVNALAAGDAVTARELEREVAEAERRYAQLVAEVAGLEEPARIEQVARDEIGMVPAAGVRFIHLDRALPEDRAVSTSGEVVAGAQPDPMKPVLSADR